MDRTICCLLSTGLAAAIALGSAGPGFATPAIDANSEVGASSSALFLGSGLFRAQSFTVGADGLLTRIDVQVGKEPGATGDVRFELRPMVAGAPTREDDGILFLGTISSNDIPLYNFSSPPPFISVDVSSAGIHAKPGDQYAISLRKSGGSPYTAWRQSSSNSYAGGTSFFRSLLTSPWTATTGDFGFRSWVDATPTSPYKLRVDATFDMAYLPGANPTLVEGETQLLIGGFGTTSLPEERPIMEFPLTSLPAGAIIQGAHLEFQWGSSSGAPQIQIRGYAGDGIGGFNDSTVAGTLLATTPPTSASSSAIVPFDSSYISTLIGNATHLGLRLSAAVMGDYVSFYATEHASLLPPRLVIDYTLPQQMPGDFTDDGVVDAADYVVWRKNPGPGETYSDWWQNFAESEGGGALSDESVPEPSAGIFVVIGCAAWTTRRRIFAQ